MRRSIIVIILSIFLLLPACSGGNKPSTSELKMALTQSLPGYLEIKSFSVKAMQNFGNKVEPDFGTRFQAILVTNSDLYFKDSAENDILFVRLQTPSNKTTEIFGKIESRLFQGSWRNSVSIEGDSISNLGLPLNQISGHQIIIRGSEEEKNYLAEIERKKEEQRKNLQNANTILIGQWRCNNNIFTFQSDGSCNALWNSGAETLFSWKSEGDWLPLTSKKYKPKGGGWGAAAGTTQREQIVYIDNNTFSTKAKDGEISTFTRIQ